jgi:hypothetical protein
VYFEAWNNKEFKGDSDLQYYKTEIFDHYDESEFITSSQLNYTSWLYEAYISAPIDATYKFTLDRDDGARVYINDDTDPTVDEWDDGTNKTTFE